MRRLWSSVPRTPGWLLAAASLALLNSCAHTPSRRAATEPEATSSTYSIEATPLAEFSKPQTRLYVLTFFDLYCVACQQSALTFIELGYALEARSDSDELHVLGIGLGDSTFEVEAFLRSYPLPYDCQADPDETWQDPFALKGTPTILALAVEENSLREIFRHEGRFRNSDLEELLNTLDAYTQSTQHAP